MLNNLHKVVVQVQPIPVMKERKALSQVEKFRNGLKLSQELALLVGEGGMPTVYQTIQSSKKCH